MRGTNPGHGNPARNHQQDSNIALPEPVQPTNHMKTYFEIIQYRVTIGNRDMFEIWRSRNPFFLALVGAGNSTASPWCRSIGLQCLGLLYNRGPMVAAGCLRFGENNIQQFRNPRKLGGHKSVMSLLNNCTRKLPNRPLRSWGFGNNTNTNTNNNTTTTTTTTTTTNNNNNNNNKPHPPDKQTN